MRAIRVENREVLASVEEIVNRLRIELTNGKLKDVLVKGDNLLVSCPHHSNGLETSPACNIYIGDNTAIEYGYFRCFVCNEQGSFLKFISECFNSTEKFAKEWLFSTFDTKIIENFDFDDDFDLDTLFGQKKKEEKQYFSPELLEGLQDYCPYLAKRNISRETCNRFNIKYDDKNKQIIFPCYDCLGNIIMLPKRSILSKKFYLDKSVDKPVYCLDYIIKHNIKKAVITEGPFDCLTSFEYGIPAVATLGNLSITQIEQVNNSPIEILYIMFDNDTWGNKFKETLKKYIRKDILLLEVKIPDGKKDINDLTKSEFYNSINNAF